MASSFAAAAASSSSASSSWLRRIIATPLQKAWSSTFGLIIRRKCKKGSDLWKLYGEVRSCSYEDVHVMWSILEKSRAFPKAKSRFWKIDGPGQT